MRKISLSVVVALVVMVIASLFQIFFEKGSGVNSHHFFTWNFLEHVVEHALEGASLVLGFVTFLATFFYKKPGRNLIKT